MMGASDTLAGQAGEQMVSPMFRGLSFLALYAVVREFGGRRNAALAAATFAIAMPFVQWTGANAKNDLPTAFFLLTSVLILLRSPSSDEAGWILTGAFLVASAENVKHTGLLGAAPLAILFLIAALRQPHSALSIAWALAIFLLLGTFWWTRSAIAHANIIYPMHAPDGIDQPSAVLLSMAQRLPFLVRLQFEGMPVYEGASAARLGPLFLLFLPAIFWAARRDWNRRVLACAFFSMVYLGIWTYTLPVLRYAVAPIALIAAGLIACLVRAIDTAPAWLAATLMGTTVLCHLATLSNLAGMSINLPRLEYVAGRIDAATLLSRTLPSYPAIAWAGEHAGPGSAILALGTHSIAYAPDPALMDSPLPEEGPFPPGEVRRFIDAKAYRYVIISKDAEIGAIFGTRVPDFADSRFVVFRLP